MYFISYHKTIFSLSILLSTVRVSAVVTDGVTVGHPCCSERDCKTPLDKVTDEYCPDHRYLGSLCCVTSCTNPKRAGFRTCDVDSHRKEEARRGENKGRRKKARKRGTQEGESFAISGEGVEDDTRPSRPASVKGVFSRRWTHNEQLMVRPCGIVVGRATFFSAESMTGVKVCHSDVLLRYESYFIPTSCSYRIYFPLIFPESNPPLSSSTTLAG